MRAPDLTGFAGKPVTLAVLTSGVPASPKRRKGGGRGSGSYVSIPASGTPFDRGRVPLTCLVEPKPRLANALGDTLLARGRDSFLR